MAEGEGGDEGKGRYWCSMTAVSRHQTAHRCTFLMPSSLPSQLSDAWKAAYDFALSMGFQEERDRVGEFADAVLPVYRPLILQRDAR